MGVRFVLCLLLALRATANSVWSLPYSCYQSVPGKSNVVRICRSGEDSCIIVQEENSYGGAVNTGIFQSCTSSLFSLEGDLDFEFGDGIYVRVHSEMCRETDCNRGALKGRPKISTVPNGRQCPSCYAPGSLHCLHNVTLPCRGGANQCVDVVGTLSERGIEIPFAARGCATRDVAKIKAKDVLISGVFHYQIKSIQLSPAPWTETKDGI